MGWCSDSPEHEGYLVGLVKDGGYRWRELHAEDGGIVDLKMVQVGCECGWRSGRIATPYDTSFTPSIVCTSPEFEELGHRLWLDHLGGSMRPIKMPWSDSGQCYMPFEMLREIREEKEDT